MGLEAPQVQVELVLTAVRLAVLGLAQAEVARVEEAQVVDRL